MLASKQASQQLYIVYSNASITNISLTHSAIVTLHPSQSLTIPFSCDNPLQCGILTQQNSLSEIYIPIKENNSLVLLKIEGEMLYAHYITTHDDCVLSDFVLQLNVDDYPLLIACELGENNSHIRYVLSNQYNETRNGTESVPHQHPLLVNPIILTLPDNDDETGYNSTWIISINIQSEVVVLKPGDSELETLPLTALNQSCKPVHIQKLRSDVIFLLTCEDGRSCLVNVSVEPINCTCFSLPANSTILALATNARYSLVKSSTNVTINEVSSQSAVFVLNAMDIYGGDFGSDDKFAYVVTDKGIHFINVVMALGRAQAENFTYRANFSLCPDSPVVFFNSTTVLVSSVESNSTSHTQIQLKFFDLSTWPPVNSMNRILNDQPRLYWYDDQYIQPTSVTPSPTPSVPPTGATDQNVNPQLSGGAVGGITAGTVVIVIICAVVVIIILKTGHRLNRRAEKLQLMSE